MKINIVQAKPLNNAQISLSFTKHHEPFVRKPIKPDIVIIRGK